jgi:hypothetical protein
MINQAGKDWSERLDFVEVIQTEFGPWLRLITADDLKNVSPDCFSLSVFNGKVKHGVPVTCFDWRSNEIYYSRIIEPDENGMPQRYARIGESFKKIP